MYALCCLVCGVNFLCRQVVGVRVSERQVAMFSLVQVTDPLVNL